jgi:hypothetical protein
MELGRELDGELSAIDIDRGREVALGIYDSRLSDALDMEAPYREGTSLGSASSCDSASSSEGGI